jgi:isopentenyl-diphosphate Delta-isomerase
MNGAAETQNRKADHLRVCLEDDVQCRETTTGLENYYFTHCCLPELDRAEINIQTTFLNKPLSAPILISSMTGGTELAKTINYRLAAIAQEYRLAMGVGSQRVAIENPDVSDSKAIDLLEADALILHLNPLQEAVQTRGDTNFRGLIDKIAVLCDKLPVPVIAKEVGNGISKPMAEKLIAAGVSAIDVAGAGGTSWAKVESGRAQDPKQRRLGLTFADWGIPTAECITEIRRLSETIPLIASGGLRNGLDVAKTIALGADLAGLALPFLQAANESEEALHLLVDILQAEITTVLFCTGTKDLEELRRSGVLRHR